MNIKVCDICLVEGKITPLAGPYRTWKYSSFRGQRLEYCYDCFNAMPNLSLDHAAKLHSGAMLAAANM